MDSREEIDEWRKKYHVVAVKHRIAEFELTKERLKSSLLEVALNSGEQESEGYQAFCRKLVEDLDGEETQRTELEQEREALSASRAAVADELALAKAEVAGHLNEAAKRDSTINTMEKRTKELQNRVSTLEEDLFAAQAGLKEAREDAGALAKQVEERVKEHGNVTKLLEEERRTRAEIDLKQRDLSKEVDHLKEQAAAMQLEKVRLEGEVAQHSALGGQLKEYTETLIKGREDATTQVVAVQSEKAVLENQIQNLKSQAEEQQRLRAEMEKSLAAKDQELTSLKKKISEQSTTIAELTAEREDRLEGGVDNVLDRIVDVMGPPDEACAPPLSPIRQNIIQKESEAPGFRPGHAMKAEQASSPRETKRMNRSTRTQGDCEKGGPSALAEENTAPNATTKGKPKLKKGKQKNPDVNRMFDQPLDALGGRTLQEVEARRNDASKPFLFLPISHGTRSVASSKGTKRKLGQQQWMRNFDTQKGFPKRSTKKSK